LYYEDGKLMPNWFLWMLTCKNKPRCVVDFQLSHRSSRICFWRWTKGLWVWNITFLFIF